jgi:uncharacterized protein YbcV (DUF1398 family)
MDSKLILEAARATLDGSWSFPEVVGKLLPAGVEYYHVDYVGLRKRFYSAAGELVATSINYEGLPPVAPEFDAAALRANIMDSQRHGQPYPEFTRRAMAVGVQGYIAFLRGKRVTYGVSPATSTRNGFRVWVTGFRTAIHFTMPNANWPSFISEWRRMNSPAQTPRFLPCSPKNVRGRMKLNGRKQQLSATFPAIRAGMCSLFEQD